MENVTLNLLVDDFNGIENTSQLNNDSIENYNKDSDDGYPEK